MFYTKEQIDLIKEFLQKKYPITITSIGNIVRLNTLELDAISSASLKVYFGEVITVDSNASVKLSMNLTAAEVVTYDNTTGPGLGISNQSNAPYVVFNHRNASVTGGSGTQYFFGLEFSYTENA